MQNVKAKKVDVRERQIRVRMTDSELDEINDYIDNTGVKRWAYYTEALRRAYQTDRRAALSVVKGET